MNEKATKALKDLQRKQEDIIQSLTRLNGAKLESSDSQRIINQSIAAIRACLTSDLNALYPLAKGHDEFLASLKRIHHSMDTLTRDLSDLGAIGPKGRFGVEDNRSLLKVATNFKSKLIMENKFLKSLENKKNSAS